MYDNDLLDVFCEVCKRIADTCPDKATDMFRLQREAKENDTFPIVINLAWLLTDYSHCFTSAELLDCIHRLAYSLHDANRYIATMMQG